MNSIFGKVVWLGRATVFLVGLAVILAAVFTVSSMAFAANGQPLILGKKNVATAVTTFVKKGPGPAIRFLARPGQPPMAVNTAVRVNKLNADRVDGKNSTDFLDGRVTTVQNQTGLISSPPNGGGANISVECPAGHKAIGGGAGWFQQGSNDPTSLDARLISSIPVPATSGMDNHTGWRATGRNFSGADRVLRVYAVCVPITP